jgi:hypothetical protein
MLQPLPRSARSGLPAPAVPAASAAIRGFGDRGDNGQCSDSDAQSSDAARVSLLLIEAIGRARPVLVVPEGERPHAFSLRLTGRRKPRS